MLRTAVFVDAGYVFAQGSILLTGEKQRRTFTKLNISPLVDALRSVVVKEAHLPLLRIYWYDAMRLGQASPEQMELADYRDIKLRLGQVNAAGEQKGVDALIVTDLVELARNQAISDAVLMSGDEDVRVGVLLSQQFGVRVHLIGIHPARSNQSRSLMQEADTSTVWDETDVRSFLSCLPQVAATGAASAASESVLESKIRPLVESLSANEISVVIEHSGKSGGIPPKYDRLLLKIGREHFGQQTLPHEQRTLLRQMFVGFVAKCG